MSKVFRYLVIFIYTVLTYSYIFVVVFFRISSSNNIQSKEYSSIGLTVKDQRDINGHFQERQIDERWVLYVCLANSIKLENTSFTEI